MKELQTLITMSELKEYCKQAFEWGKNDLWDTQFDEMFYKMVSTK